MSLIIYFRGTQSWRKVYMLLRACMGGCICLSINLQPCTLKGCFFPRGHDHIKQHQQQRKCLIHTWQYICNLWVDLILPNARQRDKCFVLLFLYIAIKYMFTLYMCFHIQKEVLQEGFSKLSQLFKAGDNLSLEEQRFVFTSYAIEMKKF